VAIWLSSVLPIKRLEVNFAHWLISAPSQKAISLTTHLRLNLRYRILGLGVGSEGRGGVTRLIEGGNKWFLEGFDAHIAMAQPGQGVYHFSTKLKQQLRPGRCAATLQPVLYVEIITPPLLIGRGSRDLGGKLSCPSLLPSRLRLQLPPSMFVALLECFDNSLQPVPVPFRASFSVFPPEEPGCGP